MAYLRQCLLELRAIERHATTIDFVDAPVTGAAAARHAMRAMPVAVSEPNAISRDSAHSALAPPTQV